MPSLRSGALFLSLLAKTGLAYLPTALSVASRPLFSFQQAQYAQVFPLKLVPSCTLFAGLGSTNKPVVSLLLLTDSRHPVLSFIFPFTLISVRNCFLSSPVLSGYNGFPDDDSADELARRGALRATNRPGMAGTVSELTSGVPCPGMGHVCPGIY